ncbi:response regulator [Acetobacteraceae bacterium]|nr:response regulator [Candidatus Parcubacteria bacterium]
MTTFKDWLPQTTLRGLIAQLAVFAVYFIAAKACLYIYFAFNTSPALIWAPVGIGLAAVIFGGYRMWLPIFLAQFLAVVTQSPSAYVIAGIIAAAYALQAVVGLYALRKLQFQPSFDQLRNTLILVGAAFFVTMIEPTIATAAQMYLHTLTVSPLLNFGRAWGAGIFSVLVITPFVATWYSWRTISFPKQAKHRLELLAAFALLVGVNYFLFWTAYPQYFGISVIFFLPAVLIWFALRFHPRWLTLSLVLTSFIGIAGSIIAQATPTPLNAQLLADEIYIGLVAAIFLVFVAVVEERRVAYTRLEHAYQRAATSDKAKNEFIAILAHELRNPLAPIVSSLELLKLQPQTEESLDTIRGAEEHAVMIRRLLDDLLDTARLSQNKFKLQKEKVSAREIVEQSLASVEENMANRRHTLQVVLPEEDIRLFADPVRMKQIVINLLTNASKYTEPGGRIELTLKIQSDFLMISVRDNGIGIEAKKLSNLFEAFTQLITENRASPGLGMGLFITKNLVELHGGTIEVQSRGLGYGSIFTVHIPVSLPPTAQRMLDIKHESERAVGASKILIVDDNEAAAVALQKLLTHHGHTVQTAYSGRDALNVVDPFAPDIILLDIGMPDMSGYDVARAIRNKGWSGAIVALTGYGQENDRLQSVEAGFDHHLIKPIGADDLISVLGRLQKTV